MIYRGSLCALMFISAAGCGGPATKNGKITGHVSVGDKAVTAGEVRFHGPNGAMGTARINGDGTFAIPDVAPGDTKVTVHPPMMASGAPPKGTPAIDTSGTGGAPAAPSKSAKIPIRYLNPDSTDLKLTVKSGDNPFDVTMKP